MFKILDLPGSLIFQPDGAFPHWTIDVRDYLNTKFPERLMGREGPIAWQPKSPALTPFNYLVVIRKKCILCSNVTLIPFLRKH